MLSPRPSRTRAHPLTDLYAQWYGARELLLHHRDPYGDDITRELQAAYYGKDLEPSQADDPSHQQRFAYPLYVVLLLAPTVGMQFHTVQIVFLWLLAAVTALSIPLWARATSLNLSPRGLAIALIVTFHQHASDAGPGHTAAWPSGGSLACFGSRSHHLRTLILSRSAVSHRDHQTANVYPRDRLVRAVDLGRLAPRDAPSSLDSPSQFLRWSSPLNCSYTVWVIRFFTALLAYDKHMRTPSLLGVYLRLPEWLIAAAGLLILAIYAWRGRREHAKLRFIWLLLSSCSRPYTVGHSHSCPALQPYFAASGSSALCSLLEGSSPVQSLVPYYVLHHLFGWFTALAVLQQQLRLDCCSGRSDGS